MVTKNSIDSNIPIEISKGGTNATSFSTSTGIVKYDGTSLVTSTTAKIDSSDRQTNTGQSSYMGRCSAVTDVTGDGTIYQTIPGVEIWDQNSNFNAGTGVFTAPVTGKYLFISSPAFSSLADAFTSVIFYIYTSNRNYKSGLKNVGVTRAGIYYVADQCVISEMDSGDVATLRVMIDGGTKIIDLYGYESTFSCRFGISLLC